MPFLGGSARKQLPRKLTIEKTIHARARMKVYYIFSHQTLFITNLMAKKHFTVDPHLTYTDLNPSHYFESMKSF